MNTTLNPMRALADAHAVAVSHALGAACAAQKLPRNPYTYEPVRKVLMSAPEDLREAMSKAYIVGYDSTKEVSS